LPGTSGLVSPFTDLNGLYFDDSNEVDDFSYRLDKDLIKKFDKEDTPYVTIVKDTSKEFYDTIVDIQKFNKTVTATGLAHDGILKVVVDGIKDMDEASTISHPKKKKAEKEREKQEALERKRQMEEEEERLLKMMEQENAAAVEEKDK